MTVFHRLPIRGIQRDGEIADMATYIRNAWGNSAPPVSATEVGKARRAFAERSD